MLSKLFEWYRIADVAPTDDVIEKRRSAIEDVVKELAAGDAQLLADAVCGVIAGFDNGPDQSSEVVRIVVEAIKKYQPAFPGHLTENHMHLRACVCIALGERLERSRNGNPTPGDLLISALLIAASGLRPTVQERHLDAALAELQALAYSAMESAAESKRQLVAAPAISFPKIAPPTEEPAAVVKFCTDVMEGARKAVLATGARTDAILKRVDVLSEELNILWWLYGNYSEDVQKPLITLPVGQAVLLTAKELATIATIPPYESTRQLVRRAISENRKTNQLGKKELDSLVSAWTVEDAATFVGPDNRSNAFINRSPVNFPLTWLCIRIKESGDTTSWNVEFLRKTGVSPNHQTTVPDWSVQLFNEIVAKRILCSMLKD